MYLYIYLNCYCKNIEILKSVGNKYSYMKLIDYYEMILLGEDFYSIACPAHYREMISKFR